MTSIRRKGWHRGYISLLSLALMITGLSSLQLYAEDGLVYPDSAEVTFTREVAFDTIHVTVNNLSSDSVRSFFLSDFTDSIAQSIECQVDGIIRDDIVVEHETGNVYTGRNTICWVVGGFESTVRITYFCPAYNSDELSWSAGYTFPFFGIIPSSSEIGPPRLVLWSQ